MKLIDLFEEKLIDIFPKDIKIENGKMIPNQFPNKVGIFGCFDLTHLTSLENCPQEVNDFRGNDISITSLKDCPKIVHGDFYCVGTKITSLQYAPKIVNDSFFCGDTKITSLEYAPLKCNGFYCRTNDIENLQGIGRKYLKECKTIGLPNTIKSNILGLCLVNKLEEIAIYDILKNIMSGPLYEAIEIVKKHLGTDGDECMEELIQNGFKDYAKF